MPTKPATKSSTTTKPAAVKPSPAPAATNNDANPGTETTTTTAVTTTNQDSAPASAPEAPVNPFAALMDPNQPFDINAMVEAAKARLTVVQESIREEAVAYQQIEAEIKEKMEEVSVLRKKLTEIDEKVKGPRAEIAKLNHMIGGASATGVPRKTTRGSLPLWLADLPETFTADDIQGKYDVSRAVINQTLSTLSKPEDGRVTRLGRGQYRLGV